MKATMYWSAKGDHRQGRICPDLEQVRADTVAVLCCSWHGQVLRRLYRTRPARYHGRDLVALPDEARQRSTVPSLLVWDNLDRKSTRLNSSHVSLSYAVFCLKQKKN